MAVVYRHDKPYRALVESIFDDSGIPIYLHDGTPLVERPLGRRALALLDLIAAPRPLLRSAVMEFLTDAHLPEATREQFSPRPARWDDVSRRAGIVEGREQWRERLGAYMEEQECRSAEYEASKEDEQEQPEPEPEEGEESATATSGESTTPRTSRALSRISPRGLRRGPTVLPGRLSSTTCATSSKPTSTASSRSPTSWHGLRSSTTSPVR